MLLKRIKFTNSVDGSKYVHKILREKNVKKKVCLGYKYKSVGVLIDKDQK